MREDIWHGAGHGTGAMAGITDGLDRLIGHNGLIRLNGQTRHNGQVCCTDNITHQQRKGLQYTKNWPHKKTVRQQPSCETGHFATQNGPFRTMKWAVLQCEMGYFAMRYKSMRYASIRNKVLERF